jgi:hypothetical protein
MDMLQTSDWLYPILFNMTELKIETGLNRYFDANGFNSSIFIVNTGSTFIYFLIYIGLILLCGIFYLVSNICGRQLQFLAKASEWLNSKLLWN